MSRTLGILFYTLPDPGRINQVSVSSIDMNGKIVFACIAIGAIGAWISSLLATFELKMPVEGTPP